MATLPLSVLKDPAKIEEIFQKIDNRREIEQLLLDPQVIEMSRQSPKSREALAAVVRRLQEDRARKKRIRNVEQKEEIPSGAKWFDCINFLKNFSAPPRHSTRNALKISEPLLRPRNKFTRSTPNLESTGLPSVVNEDPPKLFLNPQPTSIQEMSICLPNRSKDSSLPFNLMEFCNSEKGKSMITSLINSTDFKQLFRLNSNLPTKFYQLSECVDCLNCTDKRYIQYYVPKKNTCQRFIILRSRGSMNSYSRLTFDGVGLGLKSVVSSSTQTAYSGSCSQCSTNCVSIDSFNSYNDDTVQEEQCKKKPFELALFKRNKLVKGTKSQSAMYTTDYSECDCGDISSPDELCGGKYLSRVLTNAVVPNINYLTTPDVLVTYSGNGQSSDSESSSSSCKVCKGNISSESFQREPREIWTQKRLKTSCESCLNNFRTEYIRKSRYTKDIAKLSDRSGSFGSLSSDVSSQIANDIREMGEEFYVQAKSILKNVGDNENKNDFDRRQELIIKDSLHYEKRITQEQNCEVGVKKKCFSLDGNNDPLFDFERGKNDLNSKQTEPTYECSAQSVQPLIEKSISYSSFEEENKSVIKHFPRTQLDGGPPHVTGGSTDNLSAELDRTVMTNSIFSSSSSADDSAYTEHLLDRIRKQRKRVRNKCASAPTGSNSTSTSSSPRAQSSQTRRIKHKVVPVVEMNSKPSTPPEYVDINLLQKTTKQKTRKKNCAVM